MNRRLHLDVLLRREIHRRDEVAGKWLAGMRLLPFFEHPDALLVLAEPRFAEVAPEVKRLNAG